MRRAARRLYWAGLRNTRLKELENAYIRQARVNQLLLEDSLAHAEVDLTGDR